MVSTAAIRPGVFVLRIGLLFFLAGSSCMELRCRQVAVFGYLEYLRFPLVGCRDALSLARVLTAYTLRAALIGIQCA